VLEARQAAAAAARSATLSRLAAERVPVAQEVA